MIYLAIFLMVAGGGISALWLYQRHQRRHLHSVDGFRASLERISTGTIAGGGRVPGRRPSRPASRASRRPEPLDPARRAAAKRNLERRRAARA